MKGIESGCSRIRPLALSAVASLCCSLASVAAFAQTPPPMQNVAPDVHPYIAQAQSEIAQANQSIMSAQHANGFALNGHAERARRLLDQASAELKAAAMTANARP